MVQNVTLLGAGQVPRGGGGGEILSYTSYIGMCHCEG